MLLHDLVASCKPDTGAYSRRFGGKEGLENTCGCRCIHAATSIAHGQSNIRTSILDVLPLCVALVNRNLLRLDSQTSTVRHRSTGVENQVDQHPLDLPRIGADQFQMRCWRNDEIDAIPTEAAQE